MKLNNDIILYKLDEQKHKKKTEMNVYFSSTHNFIHVCVNHIRLLFSFKPFTRVMRCVLMRRVLHFVTMQISAVSILFSDCKIDRN